MTVQEVYRYPDDYDVELAAHPPGDEPFWRTLIQREQPRQVLDVGCGTGRLSLPLARDGVAGGWTVWGLDPEPAMLACAKERRDAEPAAVRAALRFVEGDVRTLDLPIAFDIVMMPYGVAHHLLDLDDQLAAWAAVRRHLAPGGLFVVDVGAPDLLTLAAAVRGRPRAVDLEVAGTDGPLLRRSDVLEYHPATQQAFHLFDYTRRLPDGGQRTYRSTFAMHIYYPRELLLLMHSTGFRVESLLGSYNAEPFTDEAPLLIACARAV